jgi:AcrR family transcriptional regulator
MSEQSQDEILFKTIALSKGNQTRNRILEAAIEISAQNGLDKLTFEAIAERIDVTRQLVKNYFPKKSDLVLEFAPIIRLRFQNYALLKMSASKDPVEMLRSYVLSNDCCAWICFFHYCAHSETHRKLNSQFSKMGATRIAELLRLGAEAKRFTSGDYFIRAKLIQAIITGGLLCLLSEELSEAEWEGLAAAAVDNALQVAGAAQSQ